MDLILFGMRYLHPFSSNFISFQVFIFEVKRPEVCQLYFRVMDADIDRDDFIGYTAVPTDCLTMGYRTLRLFDNYGNQEGAFQFASLFVRFTVQQQ